MRRICSVLIVLGLLTTSMNVVPADKNSGGDSGWVPDGSHIAPSHMYIYPDQLSQNESLIALIAVYENISAIFLINKTVQNGNNITIYVDSIKIGNATNVTVERASVYVRDLSIGTCSITVIENEINATLASFTFQIQPYGLFLDSDGIVGTLGTFIGGIENNTLYASPFHRNPTVPPILFNYTAFWANSTDSFYLAIKLTNNGETRNNVTFSLFSPESAIKINPRNIYIGTFNESSSALCLFEINTTSVPHGIYNLSYILNYSINNTVCTISGKLPMGVYTLYERFINSSEWENNSVNVTLITPFNDTVYYDGKNWHNVVVDNGSILIPYNTSYRFFFSNFSLQEPRSPWINIVIGAVAGAVIGGGATILRSVIKGEKIDWGEVAKNALIGAAAGAVIGGTFGVAGSAVLPTIAKGALISGSISAGLEAADEYFTEGEIDLADVSLAGIMGSLEGGAFAAIQVAPAFVHIAKRVAKGAYTAGKWKTVGDLWRSGNWIERSKAVHKALKWFPKWTKCKRWFKRWHAVEKVLTVVNILNTKWAHNHIEKALTDPEGYAIGDFTSTENLFHNTPLSQEDTDGDGIPNIVEMRRGTNPFDPSDGPLVIEILAPTSSKPALVGDPSNPLSFIATVETSYPILNPKFHAKVGGKTANVAVLMSSPEMDLYILRVFPPTQPSEGFYDLEISISINSVIKDCEVESSAIRYSTGSNVDVMIVIDRSGSMRGSKIAAARNSACLFVDLMAFHDMIGVASFSGSASINYPLTEITSDAIRQQAKNRINSISAGGSTSIGAGLRAGYNQLVSNGNPDHPWSIILLSDGHHNTPPHPNSVLPLIQAANIRVFTIGLGSGADANMLSYIAHNSGGGGGEYYYSPSESELNAIYNAISGIVKSESTVLNVEGSVDVGKTVIHDVYIDSSVSAATFTVSWESGTCDLELKRPDGSYVDPSDPDVISHIEEATYETFTIDDPIDGQWIMEITRTHASSLRYNAIVTAKTNLSLTCYLNKDRYHCGEPIKIISTLTKAGVPITDAVVSVKIKRPDGTIDYILLSDDGIHDDGDPDDGVYSNSYANTYLSGSYTLTITAMGIVNSENFTRVLTKSVYVSGALPSQIEFTPSVIDLGIVHPLEQKFVSIKVKSLSSEELGFRISVTDFTDQINGSVINGRILTLLTDGFILSPHKSTQILARILLPNTVKSGDYIGHILLRSNAFSVSLPVKMKVIADVISPCTEKKVGEPKFGEKDKWVTSHTPFNLTAEDNPGGSGVDKTFYRIWYNGSWTPWMEYSGNFTLNGEGKHYLEYYSVDKAGNVEEVHNQTHYVDDSPPVTNLSYGSPYYTNGTEEWITTSTLIYLNATDLPECGCGVNHTYYRINNGTWIEYTGPFTINEECKHTIEWYSVDYLGNTEQVHSTVVNVDSSPPVTNSSIGKPYYRDERGEWITSNTSIYLNSTDYPECGCGVKEIYYSYDNGTTWFVVNGSVASFYIPEECSHVVKWYAVDNLGNEEEIHERILNVDNTPPETTLVIEGHYSGSGTPDDPYRIAITPETRIYLNATDKPECGAVGVRNTYFRIRAEGLITKWMSLKELEEKGNDIKFAIPKSIIDKGGPFYLDYYSDDLLGNRENIKTATFYLEKMQYPLP